MKASDLIGSKVYDVDGDLVGHCFDVECARSGPAAPNSGDRMLQVSELLVGQLAIVQRLGYRHRDVRGPLGLRWLAHRLKGYRISWGQLGSVEPRFLRLSCTRDDLKSL